MKKMKKRGFTLVELLVVIAILAVLASVTVIGYMGFTEKANKSVDEQLCTQYNTILQGLSVEDDDVTMKELVQGIEAQDIRFEDFRTRSKDYNFAYDKGNKKVVLLDVKTGDPQFPDNYVFNSKTELWGFLNEEYKFTRGVDHYLIFYPYFTLEGNDEKWAKYNELNPDKEQKITLDIDNYILEINNVNVFDKFNELNLENGYLLKTKSCGDLPEKVKYETRGARKVTILDENQPETTEKYLLIDEFNKPSKLVQKAKITKVDDKITEVLFEDLTFVLSGDYQSHSPDVLLGQEVSGSTITSETTIKYNRCRFVNMNIYIVGSIAEKGYEDKLIEKLVINDCTFNLNKVDQAVIDVTSSRLKSYEITNNYFDTYRCINVPLPSATNKDFISKIEGNTFDLHQLLNNQDEKKDNAIQINAYGIYDSEADVVPDKNAYFTKLSIKDNIVLGARTLISIHDGNISSAFAQANKTNLKHLFADKMVVLNNDTSGARLGVMAMDSSYDGEPLPAFETEVLRFVKLHLHHYGHE